MKTCLTILSLFALILVQACTREYKVELVASDSESSFRGMSVVDDNIAWIGGSGGMIGRTTDGGVSWNIELVDGYDQFGFRSVYAVDANTAVIGNAGSPAHILRTEDGGENWDLVYSNSDSSAFIDGVDFWDQNNGMMYGDPIGGRMLLIRTRDGGRTWENVPENSRPILDENEYSFAASGTGIRCYGDQKLVISTGGFVSRLWISENMGMDWRTISTPILQGESTTGIFSFTYLNNKHVVIVGGDYLRDTLALDHVFLSPDEGVDWTSPEIPTRGYRECVEVMSGNTLVTTGPTGTDISYDGGEHWAPLSDETGFHVVRKARMGSLVLLAGSEGKIAILK